MHSGDVYEDDGFGFDRNGSVDDGKYEDLLSSPSPPGPGWQAQGVPPGSHICIWHTPGCKGPCKTISLRFLNYALILIPGSFFQAAPEPQLFKDPFLEEALVPDRAQFGDWMARLVLVIHKLIQNF